MIQASTKTDPILRENGYNLFRNNERPKLFCAVPEYCPVPSFVGAQAWSFERVLRSQDAAPPGFHNRAARAGVYYNGFYLFQVTAQEATDKPSSPQRKTKAPEVCD